MWFGGQLFAKVVPVFGIKSKKNLALSIAFINGEYILRQDVVVVQTTEWKFKANIARVDT